MELLARRNRVFVAALVTSLALHLVAVASMLTLLAPGVDMHAPASARASFIAEHPWRWRLGWAPWQATAASDVVLSIALLGLARARPGQRGALVAALGLGATILAVLPDQWGEIEIDTRLVEAATAQGSDALAAFVAQEARGLRLTGTCGAAGYTLMFLLWIATGERLAGAVRGRALYLGTGLVSALAFAAGVWANESSVRRASEGYPGFDLVVQTNAAGFGLLVVWMALLGFVVQESRRASAA